MKQPLLGEESELSVKPAKKSIKFNFFKVLQVVLGFFAPLVLGYLLGKSGGDTLHHSRSIPIWAVILGVFPVCFLTLAIHELGHLIAGIYVNFRPYLYIVGPLRIDWNDEAKWHIRLNRNLTFYGGLCVTIPTDTDELLPRFAQVLLGGPFLSLLFAAISFLAAGIFPGLRTPFAFLGIMSFGIFVITMLPTRNDAFLSDGARWLQLRRGGPLADRDAALFHLLALYMAERPSAEWPEKALQAAIAVEDGTIFEAGGRYFKYLQCLQKKDIKEAGIQLNHVLKIASPLNPTLQAEYKLEAAWFYAWHLGDIKAASDQLQHSMSRKIGVSSAEISCAKAAIALRSNNSDEARTLLTAALSELSANRLTLRNRIEEMIESIPKVTSDG